MLILELIGLLILAFVPAMIDKFANHYCRKRYYAMGTMLYMLFVLCVAEVLKDTTKRLTLTCYLGLCLGTVASAFTDILRRIEKDNNM